MIMNVICQTDKLIIEHEYEETYLRDKIKNSILLQDDFCGDPVTGLIDCNNTWAIIGGYHLHIWMNGYSQVISTEEIRFIHSLRLINENTVELLIDPWSEFSAIWRLFLNDLSMEKVQDFDSYYDKPFTENITW